MKLGLELISRKNSVENLGNKLKLTIKIFGVLAENEKMKNCILESSLIDYIWRDLIGLIQTSSEKENSSLIEQYLDFFVQIQNLDRIQLDDLTLACQDKKSLIFMVLGFLMKMIDSSENPINQLNSALNFHICHSVEIERILFNSARRNEIDSKNDQKLTINSLNGLKLYVMLANNWKIWASQNVDIFKRVRDTLSGLLNLVVSLPNFYSKNTSSDGKPETFIANTPISMRRRQSSNENFTKNNSNNNNLADFRSKIILMCLEGLSSITPSLDLIMSDNRQELIFYAKELCLFLQPNFSVPFPKIEMGKVVGINEASFGTLQHLVHFSSSLQQNNEKVSSSIIDKVLSIFISQTYLIIDDLDEQRREELGSEMNTLLRRVQKTFAPGVKFGSPKTRMNSINQAVRNSPERAATTSASVAFSPVVAVSEAGMNFSVNSSTPVVDKTRSIGGLMRVGSVSQIDQQDVVILTIADEFITKLRE